MASVGTEMRWYGFGMQIRRITQKKINVEFVRVRRRRFIPKTVQIPVNAVVYLHLSNHHYFFAGLNDIVVGVIVIVTDSTFCCDCEGRQIRKEITD